MKRLLPAITALLVTFGLGVGLTMYLRYRHPQTNKPWAANPSRDSLVFVNDKPQPTLKITVLETNCEDQTAAVHFKVTNVGTIAMNYFRVRAIYTYDDYVDDGAEFGTGPLVTGQSTEGFIGSGAPSVKGRSVGKLRNITLIPSLLQFDDGRKWRMPFLNEPTSNSGLCRTSALSGLAGE
jgi:hypothetical protein